MDHQRDAFHVGNRTSLTGLQDLVFAAISSYPKGKVNAKILREENKYFLQLMHSIPLQGNPRSQPSSGDHEGYLYSRNLRSMFDYEFEKRLQPSVMDLREMYESGEHVRAFIVTNGIGWAFRLFDFHNVSLVETNWLEFGFAKTMCCTRDVEFYLASLAKRMALGLLQNEKRMVQFLAAELETIGAGASRLQELYGALPATLVSELLSLAATTATVGETFLRKDDLESDAIFESHMVEAFRAVIGGDSKLAFSEALKLSLPSVQALAGTEKGQMKLANINSITARLSELRLPSTPHAIRLRALLNFLISVNDQGRYLVLDGYSKLKERKHQMRESMGPHMILLGDGSQDQAADPGTYELNGLSEFMHEAIRSYPNRVMGKIRKSLDGREHYSITDVKVIPCDTVIDHYNSTGLEESPVGSRGRQTVVGRAESKSCVREDEMIAYLHPITAELNEMLRFKHSLNAIAVSNGEKCIFRLHDNSNNTILVARTLQRNVKE